jgi:hypothetical protein
VEAAVLRVLEDIEDTLDEGVSFRLEIGDRKIPVKLIVEKDE